MYLSRVLINVLPIKYIVGDIFYVNWGLLPYTYSIIINIHKTLYDIMIFNYIFFILTSVHNVKHTVFNQLNIVVFLFDDNYI